jgi:hypothetical protein
MGTFQWHDAHVENYNQSRPLNVDFGSKAERLDLSI